MHRLLPFRLPHWCILLLCGLCACQSPTPDSAHIALSNALAKADTLPADQVYALALTLPTATIQDSFYTQVFHRIDSTMQIELLRQNLEYYQRLRGGHPGPDALLLFRYSGIDFLEGSMAASERKVRQALAIPNVTRNSNFHRDLLIALASSQRTQGKLLESTDAYIQALQLAEAGSDTVDIADSYLDLAQNYMLDENAAKAQEYGQRALSVYQQLDDTQYQAYCYLLLGRASMAQRDTNAALSYIEKSVAIREELQEPGDLIEGYIGLAGQLYYMRQFERAYQAAETARQWYQKAPIPFWEGNVEHMMGSSLYQLKQYKSAKIHLFAALHATQRTHHTGGVQKAYEQLAQVFKKENRPAEALDYFEKSSALKDSLLSVEKERIIQELNIRYETVQKEARIAEVEEQQKITFLWAAVVFLTLIIALGTVILLFMQVRQRRRELEQAAQLAKARALLQDKALVRSAEALQDKDNELVQSTQLLALKNQLIAELEMRMAEQAQAAEQDAAQPGAAPIYRMKILTEADWQQFRTGFDQRFPGFLYGLRARFPELTTGETRLFLLLKLGFDTKEMAGILGISLESIWKNRQRLRKKLALDEVTDFDAFILAFH